MAVSLRAWKAKQARAQARVEARRSVAELRREIQAAKNRAQAARYEARRRCRAEREKLRERIKRRREEERLRLKREIEAWRSDARDRCRKRREKLKAVGGSEAARARQALEAERAYQREVARVEAAAKRKKLAVHRRTTRAERTQESDDEVRSNLDPDLVPVFDRVRRTIKGGPRMSRTEAFLKWAEENPDQVLHAQGDAAELEARRLIAQQAELEREAHREAQQRARRRSPRKTGEYPRVSTYSLVTAEGRPIRKATMVELGPGIEPVKFLELMPKRQAIKQAAEHVERGRARAAGEVPF